MARGYRSLVLTAIGWTAMGGLCLEGYLLESRPAALANFGLSIPDKNLDLGKVWEQRDLVRNMSLRNETNSPVTINGFQTSCGCAIIEPQDLVIPPAGERTIRLKIDFSRAGFRDTNSPVRDFHLTFRPLISGLAVHPNGWTVFARVEKSLFINPTELDFVGPFICGQPIPKKAFSVTSRIPIKELAAHLDEPGGKVCVLEVPGRPFHRVVEVTPSRSIGPGNHLVKLQLQPVGPIAGRLPPVNAWVKLNVLPEIVAEPPTLLLIQEGPGSSFRPRVRLFSRLGKKIIRTSATQESRTDEKVSLIIKRVEVAGDTVAIFDVSMRRPPHGIHTTAIHFKLFFDSDMPCAEVKLLVFYGKPFSLPGGLRIDKEGT